MTDWTIAIALPSSFLVGWLLGVASACFGYLALVGLGVFR